MKQACSSGQKKHIMKSSLKSLVEYSVSCLFSTEIVSKIIFLKNNYKNEQIGKNSK